MKDVLKTIIESLVENEEDISIEEIKTDNDVTYKVTVSKDDMGRVIGKQGKVAKSIRTIMKSIGNKENSKKVTIEFIG